MMGKKRCWAHLYPIDHLLADSTAWFRSSAAPNNGPTLSPMPSAFTPDLGLPCLLENSLKLRCDKAIFLYTFGRRT